MPFRRRRRTGSRVAIVALSLLTYLCSAGPAAATVVYCISDDGHAGFELVASGERGCASCCHDVESEAAHEGFTPASAECTDITMSADQAIRATASAERDAVAFSPTLVATVHLPTRLDAPGVESERALLAPPRSSAAVLVRHTVLLI